MRPRTSPPPHRPSDAVPSIRTAAILSALVLLGTLSVRGAAPGRIRGTVRDMGRRPVAGSLVRLLSTGKEIVRVTNTDDRGVYGFEDVSAGNYDVEVSGSGFQRQIKKEILVRPPFRNIVDFTLSPGPIGGGEPVSLTAYLPPDGAAVFREVAGRFTDREKRPIPDVTILLTNPVTGASFRAISDREGRIRIAEVAAGTYRALITSPGYVTIDLKQVEVTPIRGLILQLSLVDYPLRLEGRIEDLVPEESAVPPDYLPPGV